MTQPTPAIPALVPLDTFVVDDPRPWLMTGGEGLLPKSALEGFTRYVQQRGRPNGWVEQHLAVEASCREQLAELFGHGAEAGDIALLGNASEGVNAIFDLIDWQPGDNLVIPTSDVEFPSTLLPALRHQAAGVEVRIVPQTAWLVDPEAIAAQVDARTRLVLLSHVSYRTGLRIDVEALSALLPEQVLLAIDATQSLGVVPVPAHAVDFAVVTSCKWLLAPHGLGIFYWNRRRRPNAEPHGIGWYSVVDDLAVPYELHPGAQRFEVGGPNLPSLYAMQPALQLLRDLGSERIANHALTLGARLLDGLALLELPVLTPSEDERRAGIVAWEDADCVATAARIADAGVLVNGSSGRIRVALHIYNSSDDVDALLAVLPAALTDS